MLKSCVSMEKAEEIKWIKQEVDHEDERNIDTSGLSVKLKLNQDVEEARNMEKESSLSNKKIKLQPDDEVKSGSSSAKSSINHVQVIENMDGAISDTEGESVEQSNLCGEDEEMHSNTQCYLPVSRFKSLQKQKLITSRENCLELRKQDEQLDVLPYKSNRDSELIGLEGGTRVTEMIIDNSTESRMTEEKTSVETIDQQGNTEEVCETEDDYFVTVRSEDESSSHSMNDNNSQVDTSYKITSYKQYSRYKNVPAGETPYKCDTCGTYFIDAKKLARHVKIHTEEKRFKCDICEAKFAANGTLQSHIRTHTGEKPFKCEICGADFTVKSSLKSHTRRRHTGEKPYKCDICEAEFTVKSSLQSHTRIHTGEKPYKCDICGAEFTVKSSLQSHKRTHTGERPYKCDICGAQFSKNSNLHAHRRTHTGERPFKCDICDVAFASTKDLNRHVRKHTGEKPFRCDICGMGFTKSCSLKIHIRTHTGEKPYRCDVCGIGFTQSSHLNSHKRTHTGERPFECDVCNARYAQCAQLKKHKKKVHTIELPLLSSDVKTTE